MKIQIPTAPIESGEGYVKFPDGSLICYGTVSAEKNKVEGTYRFPIPYVKPPIVTATHHWNFESHGTVTIGKITNEHVGILIYDNDNGIQLIRGAQVIAIGRWK